MGCPSNGNVLELNSYGENRQPANLKKKYYNSIFLQGLGGETCRKTKVFLTENYYD